MRLDDGRISKFQRGIYDWLKELYPNIPIEMEKLIPKSNQRIDIYIEHLNLAIECDGTFHDKPNSFYVKSVEQWEDIRNRDKRKEEDLQKAGIKLVRIPYNNKLKTSQDLQSFINNIPYPTEKYNPDIFLEDTSYEDESKTFAKKLRRKNYDDYLDKNRDKLKAQRKKEYQKGKANRKEYENIKDKDY